MMPVKEKVTGWALGPLEKSAANIGEAIRSMKLPPFLANLMQSGLPSPESSIDKAQAAFSDALFHFAVSAVVFILLFILVALIVFLVGRSLTKLSDSVPVLGTLNRIGGLVIGLALGAAEACVLLLVLGFAAPYIPAVAASIDKSTIVKFLYSMNFLYYLL
jgi:hypothetical protein